MQKQAYLENTVASHHDHSADHRPRTGSAKRYENINQRAEMNLPHFVLLLATLMSSPQIFLLGTSHHDELEGIIWRRKTDGAL